MNSSLAQLHDIATDAQLARDTADLHEAMTELVRVYQFRDRDRICCHDVSVTQFYALAALVRRGGLTLNELAAEVRLEKSSASRAVDTLVEAGYVSRSVHPESRRAVLLQVSAVGRDLYELIEAESMQEEMELLADVPPALRRELSGLLRRFATAAAARLDPPGSNCCRQ